MQSIASKLSKEAAVDLLKDPGLVPLSCLVAACDALTEGACFIWEIDTTLDELEDENSLPSAEARDRLLAGIACLANPAHLWEAGAFMAVAQTINGNLAVPEIWEPLSPAQITYAINELNYLNSLYNNVSTIEPLYGEDPKIYMAGCLFDHGFPECPEELSLCADQLERFYDKSVELSELVANPVTKRKLDEVTSYVKSMVSVRAKKMSLLKTDPSL